MENKKNKNRKGNLAYAGWLKANNYPTAVHALPRNLKDYVNELLAKGWKGEKVAKEVNKRSKEEFGTGGLRKPLSRSSIRNYREKYWMKSEAYINLVLNGDENIKKDIKKLSEEYDAFKEAVKLAKFASKRVKWLISEELKTKKPTKAGNLILKQAYEMHKGNLDMEIKLGLRKRVPIDEFYIKEDDPEEEPKEFDRETMKFRLQMALDAMEKKGRYKIPERFKRKILPGESQTKE